MNANLSTSLALRHCVIAAVVLLFLVAPLLFPAAAQTPTSASGEWELPRTAYGHPDLQGNWTNATLTPFTRPRDRGPVLTWEEVAEIELGQAEIVVERAAPSDPTARRLRRAVRTRSASIRRLLATNEVYREPGERVAVVNGEPRSSLVTNPPDGRVPALTAEGRRRVEERRAFSRQFGDYDNPENLPLASRCIVSFGSSAGPPMLPNYWYNNNYTIVQNADYVMILVEMVHDVRIIRLGEPDRCPRTSVRGSVTHGVVGKGTRSSSRPSTSIPTIRSAASLRRKIRR